MALPELLTKKEAANLLRVSGRTIQRYAKSGTILASRISPKVTLYERDSIIKLLSRGRIKPAS